MSSDPTTPGGAGAKTPGDLARDFTGDVRLGESIAKASPGAQRRIKEHLKVSAEAYEDSANWQEKTRPDRVSKERARLLERYMNDQAPRPNSPEARANDMKIIEEQSERNVSQRDQYHLDSIKRVSKSMTYQILKSDRQQGAQSHGAQDHEHDPGGR